MTERLYTPTKIRKIMEEHGFSFSKALGQNFLIDGNIVRKIADLAEVGEGDRVIEIGPGFGTLTEELLLRGADVVAVEKDERLAPVLSDTLAGYNYRLILEDALKIDWSKLVETEREAKVVANLPYYITTPILTSLIEVQLPLSSLTVMIQKEVAERILAEPSTKAYGALSVVCRFYCDIDEGLRVPKTAFLPAPKVDSAVLRLRPKRDLPDVDQELFFRLVRGGFQQRRKTILNSLSSAGFEKDRLKTAFETLNFSENLRAENLSLEDYRQLAERLRV